MDNRFDEYVLAEIKPLLEEKGFAATDDGRFKTDEKEIFFKYDDEKQMYKLFSKDLSDSESAEREINAWLFDDSQNAKDATSVGIDFAASICKELGIKSATRSANAQIDLPTAAKNGVVNVSAFAKKMLDVYPALKDSYKDHIAIYGNFLYINFFGEYLVPCIKETLQNGGKKQIKKLYDVFADVYVKGDKDTVNILVAVICAAAYNDTAATESVKEMLSEDAHFLQAFENFSNVLPKNKKIFTALVK